MSLLKPAEKFFACLPHVWMLERTISGQGTLTGTVIFTKKSETRLLCEERGLLKLSSGGESEAFRSYIYESHPDCIVIYYNDPARSGEILHELSFTEQGQSLVSDHCHICPPDSYTLQVKYTADGRIIMDYQVRGPAKDYDMHSVLCPAP